MLIIKDKIPMLKIGYPTVSDKYDVAGAVLDGSSPVAFGDLVMFSSTQGYFKKAASMSAITDAAGFVVATNVKLAEGFPGTTVQVNPGEAFNLLVKGFIAVELDDSADDDYATANSAVYVILSTGKLTTSDQASAGTVVALPNCVFTGTIENQGTVASPKYVAEIYIK